MKKTLNNLSLRKLLDNKKFTIPLSIVAAFIFWLVITIEQNPTRQQTFSDVPISISLENTVASENGMQIVTDLSSRKFTVTVSGPNYVVSSLKTEDFSIYASAAEITQPGEYELEVLGNKNTAKGSYEFVSITPATIKVEVDYIDTKKLTIEPSLVGVGADEGLVAETPVVTASEGDMVTVKAPRKLIDKISRVIAYAEVNKTLKESKSYDAQIKLLDSEGKEITSKAIELSDTQVKVTVPISKKKTIKVKAAFSKLPSGYSASDIAYSINHKKITIIGSADAIEKIDAITLSEIDFTKVSPESNKFDVAPVLPEGVKILDNIEFFTVKVDTSNYAIKTFNTVTGIKTKGLEGKLKVKKADSVLNVKICAPVDIINEIASKNLYALVDLTGKSAGEHTVDANITSDDFDGVWQIGSYTTTVTIN